LNPDTALDHIATLLADRRRIMPSGGRSAVLATSVVVIRSPVWAWFAALQGKLHDQAVWAEGLEAIAPYLPGVIPG
jgi:hypothetical protein